jgi:4-amino-4-deoxy-L-arabinose transferase-like glycosyltransferase
MRPVAHVAPPGNSRHGGLAWLALAGLCGFAFFYRLGALPLYAWDESRLAQTALEMTRNGNWLVTYYEGTPDLWSTKPPLMIWLMALSIKAFGAVEWAVRLPSAIAASITTIVLYLFLSAHLRDRLAGFLASAALMSTLGYMAKHAARSADYDALLALWTTLYLLAFYLALDRKETRSFYLACFARGIRARRSALPTPVEKALALSGFRGARRAGVRVLHRP